MTARVVTLFFTFAVASCSTNLGQKFDALISHFSGSYAFSHTEEYKLKDIHLDGVGLLNKAVLVKGQIANVGDMGTYIIIEDGQIRMLVDTSKVQSVWENKKISVGNTLTIVGIVQSSEKGHVFLTAKFVKAG